jgi:hypothetical protein
MHMQSHQVEQQTHRAYSCCRTACQHTVAIQGGENVHDGERISRAGNQHQLGASTPPLPAAGQQKA